MSTAVAFLVISFIVFIITNVVMSKRSISTTITPLPEGVTRATVIETLHTHTEMIDLNPLVQERHPIKPPAKASPEEYHCQWYEITDTVQYLPGGVLSGSVSFNACFHDLADGIQTHIYAPMGLEIRGRWTVGGSLPGEVLGPVEIGKGIPLTGLYLREDSNIKCNILMSGIVKKNMKHSHAALVARIIARAQLHDATKPNELTTGSPPPLGHSLSQEPLARLALQSPPSEYSVLRQSTQNIPPVDETLYPAPLNVRRQDQAQSFYQQTIPPHPQQYNTRFSAQAHGAPVYQHPDPAISAANPYWQPQIPVMALSQAPYTQQYPQQQTGYASVPRVQDATEKKKKRLSGIADLAGGPPTHPGSELLELEG